MNERDKELWDKSTTWDSPDPWRSGLQILASVEKFAELIRADEREACAKEADTTFYSVQAAENIRARSNT